MNEYCVCGHIKGGHVMGIGLCCTTECACTEYLPAPTPTASPCEKCAELEKELDTWKESHTEAVAAGNKFYATILELHEKLGTAEAERDERLHNFNVMCASQKREWERAEMVEAKLAQALEENAWLKKQVHWQQAETKKWEKLAYEFGDRARLFEGKITPKGLEMALREENERLKADLQAAIELPPDFNEARNSMFAAWDETEELQAEISSLRGGILSRDTCDEGLCNLLERERATIAELRAELAKLSADYQYLIVHHNRVLDKWAVIRANIRQWAVAWKRLAKARAYRCEDCGAPAGRHEAESDVWFCSHCWRDLEQ